MSLTDITLLTLLATALIFAIVELGLSAHLVSLWVANFYGAAPGIFSFLLFASLWTMLRTGLGLGRQILRRRSSVDGSGHPTARLAVYTLVINAVTMIFWLAAFAAFDAELLGYPAVGEAGALLAFAVMLWLVFLALLVLNILTASGVLRSDIADYATLRNMNGSGMGMASKQERGTVSDGPVAASEVQ